LLFAGSGRDTSGIDSMRGKLRIVAAPAAASDLRAGAAFDAVVLALRADVFIDGFGGGPPFIAGFGGGPEPAARDGAAPRGDVGSDDGFAGSVLLLLGDGSV
jgi:hypothetical protein